MVNEGRMNETPNAVGAWQGNKSKTSKLKQQLQLAIQYWEGLYKVLVSRGPDPSRGDYCPAPLIVAGRVWATRD